jgi:DNA-binding MarR family transcriptional regulator
MDAPVRSGLESRIEPDDHQALRLWLRLLSCSTEIENEIRRRLREHVGMTLSRFDYLAQLHRAPEGLRMSQLSQRLMVTGGSVTGLTDELVRQGHVVREGDPQDRRSHRVMLTPAGRAAIEAAAGIHEQWVVELFGTLSAQDRTQLLQLLGRLRAQLSQALHPAEATPAAAASPARQKPLRRPAHPSRPVAKATRTRPPKGTP